MSVHYTILDSQGNVLRSFENVTDAHSAITAMGAKTDEDLFVLRYDDTGRPLGPAVTGEELALVLAAASGGILALMPGSHLWALQSWSSTAAASKPAVRRGSVIGVDEDEVMLSFKTTSNEPTPA